ncbi:hypothetical protein [Streptomyces pseudovenezuelae]|uniref:hypothetical protein n=1 Tax=Streptomyces pseudovenezuelae TaxID=67350 RepID=UPI002E353D7C|nr:hypothetical protein [Streptomyces pseudovenezuelae]
MSPVPETVHPDADPPAVVKAADLPAEEARTGNVYRPVRELFDGGGGLCVAVRAGGSQVEPRVCLSVEIR